MTADGRALSAHDIEALRRRVGYVIQDGGLFPHLTAAENVTLMARYLGKRDVQDVLLEGGATLAWSFVRDRLVDRVVLYLAPKLIGREARQRRQFLEAPGGARGIPAQVAGHQRHVLGGGQVREQAAVLDHVPTRPRRASMSCADSARPSAVISPASGVTSATSNLSTVDLPQPEGPSSAVVRPDENVRSMPSTAAPAP